MYLRIKTRNLIAAMLLGVAGLAIGSSVAVAQSAQPAKGKAGPQGAEAQPTAADDKGGPVPTDDVDETSSEEAAAGDKAGDDLPEAHPAAKTETKSSQTLREANEAVDGDAESAPGDGQADNAAENVGAETAAAEGKASGGSEDKYPFTDLVNDTYWLPTKATGEKTEHVDWTFNAILGLSIFCFLAISIAVVYLVWRYRHRPGHKVEPSRHHDNVLEVTWTVIPSIICVLIFIAGWRGYLNMSTAPGDSTEINVTGQKWIWNFAYPKDGEFVQRGELHVPVNEPVKLIMRSEDVLHSFYVPAFRVKKDVIPNRYSYLWFEADKPGVYRVYCAEYCGKDHSAMKTKVVVHEPGGYQAWLNAEYEKDQVDCREEPEEKRAACYQKQGEKIYESKGCKSCHSLDGSAGTGPTFKGMWGQTRTFTDGSSANVDENYIRESVLEPNAKIRSGFNPVMPTFQNKLKDKDIDSLANWMKTL